MNFVSKNTIFEKNCIKIFFFIQANKPEQHEKRILFKHLQT